MALIGVDIGGTNTRVALVDEKGNILHLVKEGTKDGVRTGKCFRDKLVRMIESIPNYRDCARIGLGVPGMVVGDDVTSCRNFSQLKGYPLKQEIQKHFNKPVAIQNDAKLATLGEALAGAGKGHNTVAYVGLGTGVGGGVAIDGKIYMGATNLGGYFSRMILDGNNIAENLLKGSTFNEQKHDLREYKKNLTNLLINISVTINPDVIVLGGGVMESAQYFLEDVISAFKKATHDCAKSTRIIPVKLEYPGVVGAALYK